MICFSVGWILIRGRPCAADKKAFLLRAKYDALAEAGGKGAVRKAIEKKQKKVGQKEKKKRPYPAGQISA